MESARWWRWLGSLAMLNLSTQSNSHGIRVLLALPEVPCMSRELRMAAHQVEVEAIMALCHHNPISDDCDACTFRQQVAIEHLQGLCAAMIVSLELGE